MKRIILGLAAAMTFAGAAMADDADKGQGYGQTSDLPDTNESMREDSSMGGSGTMGTTDEGAGIGGSGELGTEAQGSESDSEAIGTGGSGKSQDAMGKEKTGSLEQQEGELTGKVVKAEKKVLYLEHMGAVVPVKIDSKTEFSGEAKRAKDFKEGDEVRASIKVKQTDNIALKIEKAADLGTGGSGLEQEPMGGQQDSTVAPGQGQSGEGGLDTNLPESKPDQGIPVPEDQGTQPGGGVSY